MPMQLLNTLMLKNEQLYKQHEVNDSQISSMLEREKERNVLLGHQQGIKPLGLEADTKKPRRLSWWRRG
jgi:mannitol/fructose-specific phosphotransferase system IIA component